MSRGADGGRFGDRLEAATGVCWQGLGARILERLDALDQYVERFDSKVNLTGFRSSEERLCRYFGEALAAIDALAEATVGIDVGSGGGTPALPLALALPEVSWTLVEPRAKRALFLEQAAHELGIHNVSVYRGRLDAYADGDAEASCVTVRGLELGVDGRQDVHRLLGPRGRVLLFSSERRVHEEARAWAGLGLRVAGSTRLLPEAPVASGWLLVAEKP